MSAVNNNKVYKKNYSFPDVEIELEESSNVLLPLLSYRLDNDNVGINKNKNIEKILTVTEIVDLIINTSQSIQLHNTNSCLLYTSPSPRDRQKSRMPSSA